MKKRRLFIFLIIIVLIASLLSITVGAANISFIKTIEIIISKLTSNGNDPIFDKIIFDIRLPRVLMAALVGIGLSISGVAFQGIFMNSMADPYVLGISSGAALGATISIIYKLDAQGPMATTICGFLGAITTVVIVYSISRVGSKIPTTTLLLSGVALNFFMSSLISMIMILKRESMERIVYWTMGSLSNSSYKQLLIVSPIINIIAFYFYMHYRTFNAMASGQDSAYILGVETEAFKKKIVFLTSLVVAVIVSFTGVIGFVGLIIPHIAKLIVGGNNKYTIPFSAVLGALFLIVCDAIARGIMPPSELPVGAVTSFFGAPYFIYLLFLKKRG